MLPTAAENLQKVADGRAAGTGDEGDPPRETGERTLSRRLKQSLGRQLIAQLPQGQFECTDAFRLDLANHQLIRPSRGVDIQVSLDQHLHAILQIESQSAGGSSPKYSSDLGPLILKRQINMARLGAR